MKKFFFCLTFLFLVCLFCPSSFALAENKVGINIGANHQDFDKAATIVGSGGWIVVMACPGDGDKIAQWIKQHSDINLVIRGHFYPNKPDTNLAKSWAATLASIAKDPAIPVKKIYFMPWNEPNQLSNEDSTDPNTLKAYINDLTSALNSYGILNRRVLLLSPMINQTYACNETTCSSSFSDYINRLGGASFFNQFYGISMNLYDYEDCGGPLCASNPNANASRFDEVLSQMGVPGKKVFAVESGVVKNGSVQYNDASLRPFFNAAFPSWHSKSNFVMSALFSYDPEHEEDWDIFSSLTGNFFQGYGGKGCCTQAGEAVSPTISLNLCPGKLYSYYSEDDSTCTECGGDSGLISCKPVSGDNFGDEFAKNRLPLNETARYSKDDEACLEASITGNFDINNLQIPLVRKLNNFLLGISEGKPPQKNPTNPFKNAGAIKLLVSKQKQDDLRLKFLDEIIARGPNSKYANYKVKGMNKFTLKNNFLAIRNKNPNDLSSQDKGFLNAIWPQVPLFANEESEGALIFERKNDDSQSSTVKTSVPEVYRLDKSSTFINNLLVPKSSSSQTSSIQNSPIVAVAANSENSQVLQASDEFCTLTNPNEIPNDKKTMTGDGDQICTTLAGEENKLQEKRGFQNDAEDACANQGSCDSDPNHPENSPLNRCCGVRGKCVGDGDGGYRCEESGCNSCLKDGNHIANCCVPDRQIKTKTFPDDKLNIKNKVPFLNKIEQTLVGQNGVFKVFIPVSLTEQNSTVFQDVAGESSTKVEIKNANAVVTKGKTGPASYEIKPTPIQTGVLFYKVGTLTNVKNFVVGSLLSLFGGQGSSPVDPGTVPANLGALFEQIGSSTGVPKKIIEAFMKVENPAFFNLPQSTIDSYLAGTIIAGCGPNACSATGPMQMTTGIDDQGMPTCSYCCYPNCLTACPNAWATYGNGGNPCLLRDNVSAAARKIKNDSGASSSDNWTREQVFDAARSYYGECDTGFARLGGRTYCQYVWDYYQSN